MPNSIQKIERRLESLERAVAEIKSRLAPREQEPWWKQTAGMFKDDPVFEEIMEEVRKLRKADYEAVNKEFGELERKKGRQNGASGPEKINRERKPRS